MSLLAALAAFQLQLPAPTGYVNDFAGVVDAASREAMLAVIDEVRTKSGGEIVVVTLRDLQGRAAIDVARDIGRAWRVGGAGAPGDSSRNTGVVLLLKPGRQPGDGQAEVAIATGTGAEGFVTDAGAGRVRDALGRAAVEAGAYGPGLVVAVQQLGALYAGEFGFTLEGRAPTVPEGRGRPPALPVGQILLVILVLLFVMSRGGRGRGGLLEALFWGSMMGGRRGGGASGRF